MANPAPHSASSETVGLFLLWPMVGMPEKKVRKKNGTTGTNTDWRLSIIMNGKRDTCRDH